MPEGIGGCLQKLALIVASAAPVIAAVLPVVLDPPEPDAKISLEVPEPTRNAIDNIAYLVGEKPEVIARELLGPFAQYTSYYLNAVVTACHDVFPKDVEVSGKLGEALYRSVVLPGLFLLELKRTRGRIPAELAEDELKVASKWISQQDIPKIMESLSKMQMVAKVGTRYAFFRAPEVYSRFIRCARVLNEVLRYLPREAFRE